MRISRRQWLSLDRAITEANGKSFNAGMRNLALTEFASETLSDMPNSKKLMSVLKILSLTKRLIEEGKSGAAKFLSMTILKS